MRLRTNIVFGLSLVAAAGAGLGARALDVRSQPAGTDWGSRASGPHSHTAATDCRPNPLLGVHDSERLKVLNACTTFAGTVSEAASRAPDGDLTFWATPDPAYASMLNVKNRTKGGMHVEIIPIDQAGCSSGCSSARVVTPRLGAHVRLTGAWVYDSWVGWNEIHPVWKVEILSGGSPPPPPPPPPTNARLRASMTGKGLGKAGARRGHGIVALKLSAQKLCWRFTRLARIGRPVAASLLFKENGKPARTTLRLGKAYHSRGCAAIDTTLSKSLIGDTHSYYVIVAGRGHRHGAIRGQLRLAT